MCSKRCAVQNQGITLRTNSFGFAVDFFIEFSVGPYDLFWKLSGRASA